MIQLVEVNATINKRKTTFNAKTNSIKFDFEIQERRMRPSESSVENDPIVFRYTQRFSKLPDNNENVAKKRAHLKKPPSVAGLSLDKNDSEEQNNVNSSDTENASPAIAYGPKDCNSVCMSIFFYFGR